MKKIFFGVISLLFCLMPALAMAAPFAYITNYFDNTVSVIDTETNTVIGAPIAVGNGPVGVTVNLSGTRVYLVLLAILFLLSTQQQTQ
jgi:YVTN family beta-propeller protein